MELDQIKTMLESTGLPVVYLSWEEGSAPPLPWIAYRVLYSNNFSADGVVYRPIERITVELYSKLKDQESEDKVESALSSLFWQKSEAYIDDERCYQVAYEFEV